MLNFGVKEPCRSHDAFSEHGGGQTLSGADALTEAGRIIGGNSATNGLPTNVEEALTIYRHLTTAAQNGLGAQAYPLLLQINDPAGKELGAGRVTRTFTTDPNLKEAEITLCRALLSEDANLGEVPLIRAALSHQIGVLLSALGKPREAIQPFKDAAALAEAGGDLRLGASIYRQTAMALQSLGRKDEGLLNEALDEAEKSIRLSDLYWKELGEATGRAASTDDKAFFSFASRTTAASILQALARHPKNAGHEERLLHGAYLHICKAEGFLLADGFFSKKFKQRLGQRPGCDAVLFLLDLGEFNNAAEYAAHCVSITDPTKPKDFNRLTAQLLQQIALAGVASIRGESTARDDYLREAQRLCGDGGNTLGSTNPILTTWEINERLAMVREQPPKGFLSTHKMAIFGDRVLLENPLPSSP